jgi:hypothetical protein
MIWLFTDANRPVRFAAGEPFCVIFPLSCETVEAVRPEVEPITSAPELRAAHEAWSAGRSKFNADLQQPGTAARQEGWQRTYFRGRMPDDRPGGAHRTKLRLHPFPGLPTMMAGPAGNETASAPGAPSVQRVEPASALATPTVVPTAPKTRMLRLVARQTDSDAVLYREGLLSPACCGHLIRTLERRRDLASAKDGSASRLVLPMERLPDGQESDTLRIMQQARFVAAHHVGRFFAHPRPLFDDAPQLVKWPTNLAMPPHAHNEHPDGSAQETGRRLYVGVVFLNDDFEGGVLYLDRLGIAIRPKPGLLIGLRGDASHRHGVSRITKGERYTMPMWLTDDLAEAAGNIGCVY